MFELSCISIGYPLKYDEQLDQKPCESLLRWYKLFLLYYMLSTKCPSYESELFHMNNLI